MGAVFALHHLHLFPTPSQILLPLINQYFTNHCLYFLSTPAKVLGSGGHASNKEKEMITRCAPPPAPCRSAPRPLTQPQSSQHCNPGSFPPNRGP